MLIALVVALVIGIRRSITMDIPTTIATLRWTVSVEGRRAFPSNVVILAMWQ